MNRKLLKPVARQDYSHVTDIVTTSLEAASIRARDTINGSSWQEFSTDIQNTQRTSTPMVRGRLVT